MDAYEYPTSGRTTLRSLRHDAYRRIDDADQSSVLSADSKSASCHTLRRCDINVALRLVLLARAHIRSGHFL